MDVIARIAGDREDLLVETLDQLRPDIIVPPWSLRARIGRALVFVVARGLLLAVAGVRQKAALAQNRGEQKSPTCGQQ